MCLSPPPISICKCVHCSVSCTVNQVCASVSQLYIKHHKFCKWIDAEWDALKYFAKLPPCNPILIYCGVSVLFHLQTYALLTSLIIANDNFSLFIHDVHFLSPFPGITLVSSFLSSQSSNFSKFTKYALFIIESFIFVTFFLPPSRLSKMNNKLKAHRNRVTFTKGHIDCLVELSEEKKSAKVCDWDLLVGCHWLCIRNPDVSFPPMCRPTNEIIYTITSFSTKLWKWHSAVYTWRKNTHTKTTIICIECTHRWAEQILPLKSLFEII